MKMILDFLNIRTAENSEVGSKALDCFVVVVAISLLSLTV